MDKSGFALRPIQIREIANRDARSLWSSSSPHQRGLRSIIGIIFVGWIRTDLHLGQNPEINICGMNMNASEKSNDPIQIRKNRKEVDNGSVVGRRRKKRFKHKCEE